MIVLKATINRLTIKNSASNLVSLWGTILRYSTCERMMEATAVVSDASFSNTCGYNNIDLLAIQFHPGGNNNEAVVHLHPRIDNLRVEQLDHGNEKVLLRRWDAHCRAGRGWRRDGRVELAGGRPPRFDQRGCQQQRGIAE
jgi:hypothetical protein